MIRLSAIGHIGKDPETKSYGNEGKTLTRFNLAATYRLGKENKTEWVGVTAFGQLGELVAKYTRKGSKLYVAGRPSSHGYKNNLEEITSQLDLVADEIEFLDRKSDNTAEQPAQTTQSQGFTPVTSGTDDLPF